MKAKANKLPHCLSPKGSQGEAKTVCGGTLDPPSSAGYGKDAATRPEPTAADLADILELIEEELAAAA